MTLPVSFGNIVKERRSSIGLTQAELANRVGCAIITIRKIEYGQLRPSVQIAERLAFALNVPEEEQLVFIRMARQRGKITPLPTPPPLPEEIGQEDLSGRAVKGFQLGERIGSGGFGIVYRAHQPSVRREVAIKIILPRFANLPQFIRRFEAEAQVVAQLEHPFIVPLYDYWREPDAAYLIMRLLRGGSLAERIEQGPLALSLASKYFQQIGQGLDAAHRSGIVHRDIKPANVLLDEEENAYLGDFGIAKNLHPEFEADKTQNGAAIGSPIYISPEQILSEPVSPQSDIYCLGILLFEMLTAQKPFPGPTPVAYIQQHLNQPLPSLLDKNPALPARIDQIIQRATAKSPVDRYRNVSTMVAELMAALPLRLDGASAPVHVQAGSPPLNTQELAKLENPYKGLRAFGEADADLFYGRSTLIQTLLNRLSDADDLTRFLAVIGPSGSGKSSVVKAGLIPALRRGGLPGSESWFIIDMTPGTYPWYKLEAALLRIAVTPPHRLLEQLQSGRRGLLRAVQRTLPDDETELVLVIDQFEELFTLVTEEDVRTAFLDSLVTAVLDPDSRLRIVVTLRADFIDRPLQYIDFGELIRRRNELVLPLMPDELEQAITQPAQRLGLRIEPQLVATMIHDVGNQPGALPMLQYALTELFELRNGRTLSFDAYQNMGGLTGALAQRADQLYTSLNADAQEATRQLFLRLVTLGEGVEDTRRRVLQSELAALQTSEVLTTSKVLDVYGRHRLLTFDHDPITREATVEVAHEALLREWGRLKAWLDKSRTDVRLQRLLADAAGHWQSANRDDSYLLRGSRLLEFESWANSSTVALTEEEQSFLQSSIEARNQRRAAEDLRRQQELETAQRHLEEQMRRVEEIEAERRLASARELALAANANIETNPERSMLLALESINTQYTVQGEEILRLSLQKNRLLYTLTKPGESVVYVDFHPNGKWVVGVSKDGKVTIWDAQSGGTVQIVQLGFTRLEEMTFSPDKRQCAIATEKDFLVYDTTSWEVRRTIKNHAGFAMNLRISPNGKLLASGGMQGVLKVWRLDSGEVVFSTLTEEETWITDIVFSPDSSRLYVSVKKNAVYVYSALNGKKLKTFQFPNRINKIALSPDGKQLFVPDEFHSSGSEATILEVGGEHEEGSSRIVAEWFDMNEGHLVEDVKYFPDGGLIAIASHNGKIKLWHADKDDAVEFLTLSGHNVVVVQIGISLNGQWLVSLSEGVARLWDVSPPGRGERLNIYDASFPIAFFKDNTRLVTHTSSYWRPTPSTIRIWNTVDGAMIGAFTPMKEPLKSAALSQTARMIACGSTRGTIVVYELETQRQQLSIKAHAPGNLGGIHRGVMWLAFSPDETKLASAGADGFVCLWDIETGEKLLEWRVDERQSYWNPVGPNGVTRVRYSRDGKHLVAATDVRNNTSIIKLWDLEQGQETVSLYDIPERNFGLALSPDGQFVSSTEGHLPIIHVWRVSTGEKVATMNAGSQTITFVEFSPDGNYLISSSCGICLPEIIVYDWREEKMLSRIQTARNIFAVSGDGRYLAAQGDGRIQIFTLDFEELLEIAKSRVTRSFTQEECQQYLHLETCPPD